MPIHSEKKPLRIGLTGSGGDTWTGGLTYQANLLQALKLGAPEVEVYVVSDAKSTPPRDFPNCHFISRIPLTAIEKRVIQPAAMRFFDHDYLLQRTFQKAVPEGVDAVYPTRASTVEKAAHLFWIPDLQFLYLPQMYTSQAVEALRKKYLRGSKNAHLVVFSSRNALKDFEHFAPEYAHKGRVVSFVAHIDPTIYDEDPQKVLNTYCLPNKFLYLPNQFWAHKNHGIVFEALGKLRRQGIKPFLVLTGNPIDSRNPMHFAELMQKVSILGIRNQIAFLGLVPHIDVYNLIRQSAAVINPSLFEGWSTTVEEAKSVGKRLALSDIPVHREQSPAEAIYFKPNDPDDVADKLRALWEQVPAGPDVTMEKAARQAYTGRMRLFAETFIEVVQEAVQIARNHT